MDARVGGERLQRVGRRGWQQDRGELGRIEPLERTERGPLEEREVEADVVSGDRRAGDERRDAARHRLERRRAGEIAVADAGETADRRADADAGIDERAEALAERRRAVLLEMHANRADLDDAVGLRVEPGGLDVERDDFQSAAVLAAAKPRRGQG